MRKDIEVTPGNVLRKYSKQEASELASQWLETFGKNKLGVGTKSYLWHVFSYERYPSLSGTEAKSIYKQQVAPEFIVLSNERDFAFATGLLPEECALRDFLVFPPNFAWTMAFTHEDGWLGPYFAKHELYSALDAENKAKVRKAKEAEMAKQKGWR